MWAPLNYVGISMVREPADEIVETAERVNVDLIVLGSKGRSNLAR